MTLQGILINFLGHHFLSFYENDGDEFLKKVITCDDTWVRHYKHEYKRQAVHKVEALEVSGEDEV